MATVEVVVSFDGVPADVDVNLLHKAGCNSTITQKVGENLMDYFLGSAINSRRLNALLPGIEQVVFNSIFKPYSHGNSFESDWLYTRININSDIDVSYNSIDYVYIIRVCFDFSEIIDTERAVCNVLNGVILSSVKEAL